MNKKLYIIPGFGENTNGKPYRTIGGIALRKGYEVIKKHPNWKKPLSQQLFKVGGQDVIFGFSLGAVLGYMIAQQYPCKKIILASMTPFSYFSKNTLKEVIGKTIFNDLKKITAEKPKTAKMIKIYGEEEKIVGDIVISSTGHELNDEYLKEIEKLL